MTNQTKTISRRDMIRMAGVAAIGLAYVRPSVQTVYAKPAFDEYPVVSKLGGFSPGGWGNNGSEELFKELGYSRDNNFNDTFGLTGTGYERKPEGATLGYILENRNEQAENYKPEAQLASHSIAALLNAAYFAQKYQGNPSENPYQLTPVQVISLVQQAYMAAATGLGSALQTLAGWFNTYHQYDWDADGQEPWSGQGGNGGNNGKKKK
jgi:hypothetical protein